MRKLHEMIIDRALLLYVLHLAEPHGVNGDVKLQQLLFLCELQLFAKGLKGLHFEFFRYAYGAFSKDLDNDLLSLRRRGRIENFSPTEKAGEALKILPEAVEGVEANEKVIEIVQAVTATYAPQDGSAIVQSVEAIEISSPEQPEFKLAMRDISFHSTLLVPSRIEVKGEFTLAPAVQIRLNAALGY